MEQLRVQGRLTIPKQLAYYVPRILQGRRQLSELFLENSEDVIVFRGVQISNMVALNQDFDTSSNALKQPQLETTRLLLDDASHFKMICEIAQAPVHLVEFQENNLVWVQSHNSMHNVQENVDKNQKRFSEENLFAECFERSNNEAILISSTPGTGKSTLLSSLARRITGHHPESIVIYLELRAFAQTLHEITQGLEDISENHLAQAITEHLKKGSIPIIMCFDPNTSYHLMLDGYDEMLDNHQSATETMIRFIVGKMNNVRLWITTQPHPLPRLENILGVLGYTIEPFDKENQLTFFRLFWLERGAEVNKKLECYSNICFSALNSKTTKRDKQVTGIPLLCLMMGENWEEAAVGFSKYGASKMVTPVVSFIGMYGIFGAIQLQKYRQNNPCSDQSFAIIHTKLAFQLLFPELMGVANELLSSIDEAKSCPEFLNTGMVEYFEGYSTPKFVHQTFAEYFVAKMVVQMLDASDLTFPQKKSKKYWEHVFKIFEVVFANIEDTHNGRPSARFLYPTLCHFVEAILKNNTKFRTSDHSAVSNIKPEDVGRWMTAAVRENHLELAGLFDLLFPDNSKKILVMNENQYDDLICNAIATGDINMVKIVYNWPREWGVTESEWEDIFRDADIIFKAAARFSSSVFKFVYQKMETTINGPDADTLVTMLQRLLRGNSSLTEEEIAERKEMIKFILATNENLMTELPIYWRYNWVDLNWKLAMCFLENIEGSQLNAIAMDVICRCLCTYDDRKISGKEFHSLVKLYNDKGLVFKSIPHEELEKIISDFDSILHLVLTCVEEVEAETLEMLCRMGADVNALDGDNMTVLQFSIKYNCGDGLVAKLKELGATGR